MAVDPFIALLQGGDPLEEQKRMAARLRNEQNMARMLQGAQQDSQGLDMLNFVSQNANNPQLAGSVGLLQKARQAQFTPQKLDKGIYVPGSGEYQESPGVADEREAERDNKRIGLLSTYLARQDATRARGEQAAQADETRRLIGGMMGQAALERAAAAREAAGLRRERDNDRDEMNLQKMVQKFSADQKKQGLPQVSDAVRGIHEMLGQPEGQIAGIGYGQETLSKIPFASDFFQGPQGKANRSKLQKLINAMIETEAGKNVTKNEMVRQMLTNMTSDNYNEADFRNAMIGTLLPALEDVRANALRGYDPKVVDRYLENADTGYDPRASFRYTPKTAPKVDSVAGLLDKYAPKK